MLLQQGYPSEEVSAILEDVRKKAVDDEEEGAAIEVQGEDGTIDSNNGPVMDGSSGGGGGGGGGEVADALGAVSSKSLVSHTDSEQKNKYETKESKKQKEEAQKQKEAKSGVDFAPVEAESPYGGSDRDTTPLAPQLEEEQAVFIAAVQAAVVKKEGRAVDGKLATILESSQNPDLMAASAPVSYIDEEG